MLLHCLTSLIKFIVCLHFVYRQKTGERHQWVGGWAGAVSVIGRPCRVLLSYTDTDLMLSKHLLKMYEYIKKMNEQTSGGLQFP